MSSSDTLDCCARAGQSRGRRTKAVNPRGAGPPTIAPSQRRRRFSVFFFDVTQRREITIRVYSKFQWRKPPSRQEPALFFFVPFEQVTLSGIGSLLRVVLARLGCRFFVASLTGL